jgi:hypothetical protein
VISTKEYIPNETLFVHGRHEKHEKIYVEILCYCPLFVFFVDKLKQDAGILFIENHLISWADVRRPNVIMLEPV